MSTLAIVGLFAAAPLVLVAIVAESWWLLAVAAVLVLVGWVGSLHTGRRVIAQEQAGVEPSSAGLALFLYIVVAVLRRPVPAGEPEPRMEGGRG